MSSKSDKKESTKKTTAAENQQDISGIPGGDVRPKRRSLTPDEKYEVNSFGMARISRANNGGKWEEQKHGLCNFIARIEREVRVDNGEHIVSNYIIQGERGLEIELDLKSKRRPFPKIAVPAREFDKLLWVEQWGPSAIVAPGQLTRERLRAAIKLFSGDVPVELCFGHLGWRTLGSEQVFLHASGAISASGMLSDVKVVPPHSLSGFNLPEPSEGSQRLNDIRSSLAVLEVAPDIMTIPGYMQLWRAPLGASEGSLHAVGPTEAGKTSFAAVLQQHFGAGMDPKHLPVTWSSTTNAAEGILFYAKDCFLVIDDFAPSGTSMDISRKHHEAGSLFRRVHNQSGGRQRMRPDGSLATNLYSRASAYSTGEDLPRQQSVRNRVLVVEFAPDAMNWRRLSTCQQTAAAGTYARAMAAYLQWLAPKVNDLQLNLPALRSELQHELRDIIGRRTSNLLADLLAGFQTFLHFALDVRAITPEERERYWARALKTAADIARAQVEAQRSADDARRYLELLSSALSSGRAHLVTPEGLIPPWSAAAAGWTVESDNVKPRGEKIGWLDDEDLYLDEKAAYAVAQRLARDTEEPLALTHRTLAQRMRDQGLLRSTGIDAEKRQCIKVRRQVEGTRREVLHLDARTVLGESERQSSDRAPRSESWAAEITARVLQGQTSPSPDPKKLM